MTLLVALLAIVVFAPRAEAFVYWANGGAIGRANLDGTVVSPGFIAGTGSACGIAVDAGHVYWARTNPSTYFSGGGGTIGRANLDGTGVDQNFITGADFPCGVAVDAGHIYWANSNFSGAGDTIGRANLDGTAVDRNFISDADFPTDPLRGGRTGLAVDGSHIACSPEPATRATFRLTGRDSPRNACPVRDALDQAGRRLDVARR